MKIKINDPIKDFEGDPVRKGYGKDIQNLFNKFIGIVNKNSGSDIANKISDEFSEAVVSENLTYKSVIVNSLMSQKESKGKKDLEADYDILKMIYDSKQPDIDKSTAKKIYDRICESYSNPLIIGRCKEMLIEGYS